MPRTKPGGQRRSLGLVLVCISIIATVNLQSIQGNSFSRGDLPDGNLHSSEDPRRHEPLNEASAPAPSFYDFRDDFDYSSIGEMEAAGWTICSVAPTSYYSVSKGILTLKNGGYQGAAACWRNVPTGISDWTVTARVSWVGNTFGSLDMSVRTLAHSYRWLADGFSLQYKLFRDGIFVWTADGYSPELGTWHVLRMDMYDGMVSLYFDQQSKFNYTETDTGTYLTDLILSGSWQSYDDFDYVTSQQFIPSYPEFVATPQIVSQNVVWGETAYFPVALASVNSFAGEVLVGPSFTYPPGLSVAANPQRVELQPDGGNTTMIAVSTASAAAYQMHNITTVFNSGSLTHTLMFILWVSAPPPPSPGQDFSMTATPTSLTIIQSTDGTWPSAVSTVDISSVGGFAGEVELSVQADWNLGSAGISPTSVLVSTDSPATATLTVFRSPYERSKTLTLNVYVLGTSAGPTHMVNVTVGFQTPSFTFRATPPNLILVPSETGSVEITITSLALSDTISFNASLTPTRLNGPVVSLSTRSQFLSLDGTAQVTLTAITSSATPTGTYVITIMGETSSSNESTTVTLYVASRAYNSGVTVGTTARYSLTASDPTLQSVSIAMTIVSVVGHNISYRVDVYLASTYLNSTESWIDIATGETSPVFLLPFVLVAADLNVGDSTYLGWFFQAFRVTRLESSLAAGTYRSTIAAEIFDPNPSARLVARWDRRTGLLSTLDVTFPYNSTIITAQIRLVQTSAWTKLTSSFATEVSQGFLSAEVSFTANVQGGQNPYTYLWQFGDGINSTEANPTHVYRRPGNYTPTLRVSDSAGNTAETNRTVSLGRLPTVNLSSFLTRWLRDKLYSMVVLVAGTWIVLGILAVGIFARQKSRARVSRLNT